MSYNSKAYTWYNLSISKTIYKKINGEFKEKKTQIWKKSTVSKHLKKQISKLMRLISSQKWASITKMDVMEIPRLEMISPVHNLLKKLSILVKLLRYNIYRT